MVREVAPQMKSIAPVQTLKGMMQAQVCTPEHGCVLSQVMINARIDHDGTWHVAYWDPEDPLRQEQASGSTLCGATVLADMFSAIASLPLELAADPV